MATRVPQWRLVMKRREDAAPRLDPCASLYPSVIVMNSFGALLKVRFCLPK
jgi:hypothetical protein